MPEIVGADWSGLTKEGKFGGRRMKGKGRGEWFFFFLHNDEMNLCAIIFTYVLLFGWAYQGVGMVFFFSPPLYLSVSTTTTTTLVVFSLLGNYSQY